MINARHIAIAAVVAILLVLAGFIAGCGCGRREHKADEEHIIVSDTTWFTVTETKLLKSPPDTVLKTKTKVVKVPLYITTTDTVVDSVLVELPFERHFARLEDVAEVWYSGYEARIDSSRIHRHHTTEIITQTMGKSQPCNMVMITAGAKDASLSYLRRFGPVWVGANAGYTFDGQPMVRGTIGFQF